MATKIQEWSVDEVESFLQSLSLDALVPEFRKNAVNGEDLLHLNDDEFSQDLQCTSLQIKKIRRALEEAAPGSMASHASATARPIEKEALTAAAEQQPFIKPDFKPEEIKEYESLKAKVAELEQEQVEHGAFEAHQRLHQATASKHNADKKLHMAAQVKAEAEEGMKSLENWYFGKNLPGKLGDEKRAKKHSEKQQALDAATATFNSATAAVENANKQLEAAQNEAKTLSAKVEELGRSRSALASLVQRIFEQPSWATDPTLTTLRAAIGEFDRQAAEASSYAAPYHRGRDFLASAKNKIAQAMGALQQTEMMNTMEFGMDMMTPYRRRTAGGFMMNMGQMAAVQRSNELIKSAVRDFLNAKQILPQLPYHNDATVESAQQGVFVSVLAPGMMGNMAERMMIRKSMEEVKDLQAGVQQCFEWAQRNLDAFTMDVNRLRGGAEGKRAEILAYQHAELDKALGVGAANGNDGTHF